jgi:hypothetical protein
MLIMIIVLILLTAAILLTSLAPASASDDCPPEPPVYGVFMPMTMTLYWDCSSDGNGGWICGPVPEMDER